MNFGQVARMLAGFVLFFTVALFIPLLVSLGESQERATTSAFLAAMSTGAGVAVLLWFLGRRAGKELYRREGLAVVGSAWFLAGAIAAIPFVWSGSIPRYVDAYFECISGLTTTGATVLGTNNSDIESLPSSILLWRSLLQWMGGIGIVLVFIVLLPGMGVTGSRLLASEQVGLSSESDRPRMAEQARRLFGLYVGLTTLATLSYWAAGMTLFDGLCHSFTTLATGGFSNNNYSVGGYKSLAVELVAVVFMFLAGCNFLMVLGVLMRRGRPRSGSQYRSEFLVYLGFTVVVTLGVALSLWRWGYALPDESLDTTHDYGDFGRCLRDGVFQTVSIMTTTGYANADFERWPKPALFLLFVCMFIGGCTGSTAGGFKMLRAIISAKLARYSLRHFVRPRSVEKLRVGAQIVPNGAVSAVLGLLVLWLVTVIAGTLVLGLDPRLDLMSALTASLSMMGCVGPAFGEYVQLEPEVYKLAGKVDLGPYSGYGELYSSAKVFMCVQMVLGRLEILAPLAILSPRFWKV